jgi:tetratricopeptide (TPR) repeat protein
VKANPTITDYQSDLAETFYHIGNVLWRMGKPTESLAAHGTARANYLKVSDAHPTNSNHQAYLARSEIRLGRLQARAGNFAEAFAVLDQGLARCQKLVFAYPENPIYINDLGSSHADRGGARVRAGHPAEAADDLRRALAQWDKLETPHAQTRFERTRALALLAGLGGDAMSGVTASEAAAFADQAVAALRDAVQAGWAQGDELKEPDFDSLRRRDDYQKLLQELEAKMPDTSRPMPKTPAGPQKK